MLCYINKEAVSKLILINQSTKETFHASHGNQNHHFSTLTLTSPLCLHQWSKHASVLPRQANTVCTTKDPPQVSTGKPFLSPRRPQARRMPGPARGCARVENRSRHWTAQQMLFCSWRARRCRGSCVPLHHDQGESGRYRDWVVSIG